jgi:O-antigen/teichoic acid export membrane protein
MISLLKKISPLGIELIYNSIIALVIKFFSLFISLFIIPSYILYFSDNSLLGFWFTVLAFFSAFLTFDLGIGNGLRQLLIKLIEKNETRLIKSLVSSTYLIIGLLIIFIGFSFLILSNYIDWNFIFNIPTNLIPLFLLKKVVNIVFFTFLVNFQFRLVNSILHATQKSGIVNLSSFITNLLIVGVVFLVKPESINDKILFLSYFYFFALNFPVLIMNLVVFWGSFKKYRPSLMYFNFKLSKEVLLLGLKFFLVQIAFLVIYGSNEYLISILTSSIYVVEFQIYSKFFLLISSIYSVALIPLWSAVSKLIQKNNLSTLIKYSNWFLILALFFSFLEVITFFLLPYLLKLWLADQIIIPSLFISIVFAILGIINIFYSYLSSLSNGLNLIKSQTILLIFAAFINIPLSISLVYFLNSWIGVVISNIFSLLIFCLIQPIIINRKLSNLKDSLIK